ncbi:YciI family protein [Actinocorallia longicatena]|uniref:YciI family protein n=1 Tax=Actinocorallia longicatena TaxID=111803 RepID=A0ABP6QGB2_9ACTN
MKYMLMICGDEESYAAMLADEAFQGNCHRWAEEMGERGILGETGGLQGPEAATTLRVRDGRVLLSDGPFAETKEVIAGFSIVDCADLDEAIEVASRHPVAPYGTLEIRPFTG